MNQEEKSQFEIMSEAISALALAVDQNQVLPIAKRFLRDFTSGAEHARLDHGMLGIFMLKSDGVEEKKRISVSNWSAEFVAERARMNGYVHDPSVIMVQQTSQPFTWAQGMEGADAASLAITDLCEMHTGQRNGLTLPISGLNMLKGAATIGFDLEPGEFSHLQIGMIHHVFNAAYSRLYKQLGPFPEDKEAPFSPRQREIIRLLALGYTISSASVVLQCSRRTAKYHVEAAMEKVGAKTQAQLIAKSVRKVPLS